MRPSNWKIVIGLPLTVEELYHRADHFPNGHFGEQVGSARRFEQTFAEPARRMLDSLEARGCSIDRHAGMTALTDAFATEPDVVSLVAHWTGQGEVELANGFHDHNAIVHTIPRDFRGIIDLCVCHPEPLVLKLKSSREVVVRYKGGERSRPLIWLALYEVMAAMMQAEDVPFDAALTRSMRRMTGAKTR